MEYEAVGALISPPYNINVYRGSVIDAKTNLVCQCFTAAFLHLASLLAAEAAACPIITRRSSRPHAVPSHFFCTDHRLPSQDRTAHFRPPRVNCVLLHTSPLLCHRGPHPSLGGEDTSGMVDTDAEGTRPTRCVAGKGSGGGTTWLGRVVRRPTVSESIFLRVYRCIDSFIYSHEYYKPTNEKVVWYSR